MRFSTLIIIGTSTLATGLFAAAAVAGTLTLANELRRKHHRSSTSKCIGFDCSSKNRNAISFKDKYTLSS